MTTHVILILLAFAQICQLMLLIIVWYSFSLKIQNMKKEADLDKTPELKETPYDYRHTKLNNE